MKSTEAFKNVINAHLLEVAAKDPLFAKTLKKPNKNIDDCITYILNTVQKSGCSGFTDAEVFGMAIHYYDEDTIEVGKPVNCNVVVNHTVEPAPANQEKQTKEIKLNPTPKQAPVTKPQAKKVEIQTSLFDF